MPHFSLYPAMGNDTYPLQPFGHLQADAAAVDGQQAVTLHGGKRAGQRTAVDAQMVGQLLAVKGQLKLQAALLHGQRGKVGRHPLPEGVGWSVQTAAGQILILASQIVQ